MQDISIGAWGPRCGKPVSLFSAILQHHYGIAVLRSGAREHSLNDEHSVLPLASAADDGEAGQPGTVSRSTVCPRVKVRL